MDEDIPTIQKFFQTLNEKDRTYSFIAGFMAFIMFIPDQVASVVSRHMAVAFGVPENTTGIYFAKLFSFRSLVMLLASLSTYIIKWFVPEDNIILTLTFSGVMLLSRFILLILVYFSKNLPIDIYNVYVFEAFSLGLFQLTFYSLTPEYVSLLSLSFKLSKICVFLVQLIMDLSIYERPLVMVRIHFWFILIITIFSSIFWSYYCFTKVKRKGCTEEIPDTIEINEETMVSFVKYLTPQQTMNDTTGPPSPAHEYPEPTFAGYLKRCQSPFWMCIISLALKNFLYPGILPYALLERDKCHKINMAIIPVGLIGCFIIHVVKKRVKAVNERWTWHWHLFWIVAIPEFIVLVFTFVALHTNGSLAESIINSRKRVLIMAIFLFFSFIIVETIGFVGVVSNVKHHGKLKQSALRVISTNQLTSILGGFFSYKLSVGYNVTRSVLQFSPRSTMNPFVRFLYWTGMTIKSTAKDFINDFRLNIKDYV